MSFHTPSLLQATAEKIGIFLELDPFFVGENEFLFGGTAKVLGTVKKDIEIGNGSLPETIHVLENGHISTDIVLGMSLLNSSGNTMKTRNGTIWFGDKISTEYWTRTITESVFMPTSTVKLQSCMGPD